MRQTSIRPGSSGPFVREMQAALNSRLNPSPNLKITGIFDIATGRAVRAFQTANWLEIDSCAGACTLDALYNLEKSGPIQHSVIHISQSAFLPAWSAALAMLTKRTTGTILAAVPPALLNPDKTLASDPDPMVLRRQRSDLGRFIGLNHHSARNWLAPDLITLLRHGPLAIECPRSWIAREFARTPQLFLVIAGARGSHSRDGSSTTLQIFNPVFGAEPIRSQSFLSLTRQFNQMPFAIFTP
mgnify:CR=1 FL=1